MPELIPFRAVSYSPDVAEPGDLLAPPYDVIGTDEARTLRGRSPFNAVHLVLPEGGTPGRYERAAKRLHEWLDAGILRRDRRPSLHVYRQSFRHEGSEVTRTGVFGALPVTPFARGEVLPHEETHRGPKRDRLALMRECRAQLSPIFLVARDPARRLTGLLDRGTRGSPRMEGVTPDGVRHRLWRVVEGPLSDEIRSTLADDPLLIADGHHRFETALEMARDSAPDAPERRMLACVVSGADPGLLCLPTHRSLKRPPEAPNQVHGGAGAAWRALLHERFRIVELEELSGAPADGIASRAASEDAMVAVPAGDGPPLLLRPREDRTSRPATVEFDRELLRPLYDVGPDRAMESGLLDYHRDAPAAVAAASDGGAAFLLPPPDVDGVWAGAGSGERLPPKSTYFWPKLPSGLLFRLLED